MSVFSFIMLLIQIALKVKKMWLFLPILATGGQSNRTDVATVKLMHCCVMAAASWLFGISVKGKTSERFLSLKAVQRTAAQQSRAHLHQLWADHDDPSMKVGVFSSSLVYLQVFFSFLQTNPNTKMHSSLIYWVFIMTDNRIWNLVVKMTTHGLSGRNGILALLVLIQHSLYSSSDF